MIKGKWRIGAVAAVFAIASAAPAAANILPVGQWDLNEASGTVAHDDSFLTHSGTLQGDVTWTAGRFLSGLSFSGGTGAVDIPDSPSLDSPDVTVSAWVQNTGSPGDYKYIVAKGANGCCTGSYGLYTGANGGLEFYAATSTTGYVVSPDAGTGVWDGKWHNVIGTFDGSSVRLYVDGHEVGSGSADGSPIQYGLPSSNDLIIGNYAACPGLGFSGKIDEVKVFDRALGAGEINLGYLASRGLPPVSPFDLIL